MDKKEKKNESSGKTTDIQTKKNSRFNKKNELTIILLSITFSFTIFFFSPIDIFLGNQRDFVVSFGHVAVPMLLTSLAFSAVLILLMNLFLLIHQKAYTVISRLFFGILLAGYVQSLLLNSKMTAVTGDDASYKDNKSSVIFNLVLLSFIALVPLILSIVSWFAKKNKFLLLLHDKGVPYLCGLIFFMQAAGIGSSILTTDFGKYKKMYTSYLSYEQGMSLSKDENVVVFLTDRLDSFWMDRVIKEYPDVKEKFDGFTFYQNNVSHNTSTFPSVPQMLTNSFYKGEEWTEYVNKAWDGDTVPKVLTENDYNVNLLIDNLTTYSSIAHLEDQCINISHCDPEDVKFNYLGEGGIIPSMTQLSLAKLSPYMWKGDLVTGFGSNLSADFIKYNKKFPDMMPMAIGPESDIKYFDYIKSNEFNADSPKKTFAYVHLNGAHDTAERLAALYDDSIDVDRWVTTRGDFEILFYYFDQLKKLGIYDNTTIIVLGDHGRAPDEVEREGKEGLDDPIVTALLVKPANAESGKLKLDDKAELSLDFFPASVIEYAGIDHKDFGTSFNDVIEGGLHPDRWLQTYEWGGYGKVIYKTLYKITGDARDFANWEPQPEHE